MEKPKHPDSARDGPQITPGEDSPAKKSSAAPEAAPQDVTSAGGHGAQAAALDGLTRKAWEATEHRGITWSDDPKSRLAIRVFSRGFLGAAFFTAGGLLTKKWMNAEAYNPLLSFSEQKNPLQKLAKVIDTVIGVPIEKTVSAVAGKQAGMASVHFRPTHHRNFGQFGKEMRGRSLGDEVVNVTFDFFCASIGDAWGRDIAGWIDPNAKKCWRDDKGNLDIPNALQTAVKSAGRYVTYNGGEDWAVAVPYVYFMKGQRSLLNKVSPGFQYDFDRQLNGGSFRMKDNRIAGNYNMTGIVDLQSRFTAYNIGTLMYREAYDYIGNKLQGKPAQLFGAPDKAVENRGVLGGAADLVKWTARSVVKAMIVMTPAVPFFWMMRTPQTKHRGLFIDPEKGILGVPPSALGSQGDSIHANTPLPSASTYVDYWQYQYKPGTPLGQHRTISPGTTVGAIDPSLVGPPGGMNTFDAHARSFGPADAALNTLGKANYNLARAATGPAEAVERLMPDLTQWAKGKLGIAGQGAGRFIRPMMYASAAYTPYMYAKAEFANLWDDGKMDLAAERLVDGVAKLNWGEFKKGAGEVYNAVLQRPLEDPARETEAQRRKLLDTSPADVFLQTQAEQKIGQMERSNWRDRIISGPPVEKQIIAAHDEKNRLQPRKKVSYAEQEAMRKALEELSPPTNSIN